MNSMKKIMKNRIVYGVLVVIIFWYLMHKIYNSAIIPDPYDTIKKFIELFQGDLSKHLIISTYRILCAVFIAVAIGAPIGLLCGINKTLDLLISPIAYILYPIPKVAFLPVFMLIFGLGNAAKIILIITIIIFQIQIAARDAVKDIQKEMVYSVKSLGMNRYEVFRYLIIPATLPSLISSIRTTVGISISALFLSENFSTKYGIGYFIMNSWIMADYTSMFAGIIGISILGFIIFGIIDFVERKVCKWLYI